MKPLASSGWKYGKYDSSVCLQVGNARVNDENSNPRLSVKQSSWTKIDQNSMCLICLLLGKEPWILCIGAGTTCIILHLHSPHWWRLELLHSWKNNGSTCRASSEYLDFKLTVPSQEGSWAESTSLTGATINRKQWCPASCLSVMTWYLQECSNKGSNIRENWPTQQPAINTV